MPITSLSQSGSTRSSLLFLAPSVVDRLTYSDRYADMLTAEPKRIGNSHLGHACPPSATTTAHTEITAATYQIESYVLFCRVMVSQFYFLEEFGVANRPVQPRPAAIDCLAVSGSANAIATTVPIIMNIINST